MRKGKCTNFGLCAKADKGEAQSVPAGSEFVCEECKRPLTQLGAAAGGARRSSAAVPLVLLALLLLVVLAAFLLLRGRNPGTVAGGAGSGAATGPAPANATTLFRLSGSNTIGAQLAPDLVQAWMASKGFGDIRRSTGGDEETVVSGTQNGSPVSVDIKARGSATAFTDLASGAADLGMASRKITAAEAANLAAKGMGAMTSNSAEKVLGLDGVAVIVNEANPMDSMTKEELANIFSGGTTSTKWDVYARDAKSGTYDTFKDRVLGNRPLVSSAKRFEDSRALVDAVSRDRNGIGFVGLPYATGVKVLSVAERGASALVPNVMTVRTEAYPLSRRLYFCVPDNAKPDVREFVRFALSTAGQDIVEKDGFVGQKVEVTKVAAPANAPKDYIGLMPSADRLSVDFRFRTGSSELDTKAVDDIKRLAASMGSQFAGRGVMLVGFADSTGNPATNLRLSKQRAESVAAQMKMQGITPVFVTGFGQELPVADNSTEDGREKNRRVEVWLRK